MTTYRKGQKWPSWVRKSSRLPEGKWERVEYQAWFFWERAWYRARPSFETEEEAQEFILGFPEVERWIVLREVSVVERLPVYK